MLVQLLLCMELKMPSTYQLISSFTVSTAIANVTFSSIPGIYTDLELRYSARDTSDTALTEIVTTFNGESSSGTLLSSTILLGEGSLGVLSRRYSSQGYPRHMMNQPSNYTATTFSNGSFYIPNYTSTTSKQMSIFATSENSATDNTGMNASANLYRNSAAITSINLKSASTFVANSSFYLYGIKNS
jgi:hypothetical protein